MSFHVDDGKLLEKYKTIWTNIEDLQNIELNVVLPVYDDRNIKNKIRAIRAYDDKIQINFCGLNVPEDDIECEYFTFIFIDSFFVYKNKYYLQVYLYNCAYKLTNKQMTDYLDYNIFKD